MSAPAADAITSAELYKQLESVTALRIIDVRTPAEFETSHISGSHNVPLDVLDEHSREIAQLLGGDPDAVLVCRSGQRSIKAQKLLRNAGLTGGRVLEKGILDWEGQGFSVDRGAQRWDLERQVRLFAGSVVLSAVVGSVAVPRLKWLAAGIGAGLSYAAISDTCPMATALSKLPYNRGARSDAEAILSDLKEAVFRERAS
ncbi:rhodanese-like domain-containing protein [Mycobacterium sp. 94-17]|uniref:rhodanese-like domain-containing protein n=1 Tax=Mycobacterium sp. 94-17 TaxID=2986147 RepID=UPI002D1F7A18|nr:rhodanese-like domain-containing protein [Mycobacterium sp. 94-17]MEB4209464.1 rhodanese-like domain-containing protein [Mycobacterium sp. 94-17]